MSTPPFPARASIPEQAVYWFVELGDHPAPAIISSWKAWLAANPAHEQAWLRLKTMDAQWQTLPEGLAKAALTKKPNANRRNALRTLCLVAGGGLTTAVGSSIYNKYPSADFRTAVGEQRYLDLRDGTRLLMNTCSAVNINFDNTQRHVTLIEGEIMLKVAAHSVPLLISTPQGEVQAQGQQLSVRLDEDSTLTSALAGALTVRPGKLAHPPLQVASGKSLRFSDSAVLSADQLIASADAWTNGMLIVHLRPLGDFLAELSRYRKGWIRWNPAIANLRVSGSYPLADTDKVLRALATALPINIRYLTQRLVMVEAR